MRFWPLNFVVFLISY
uniref:Uncharacterized protein n=1 Tax=Rhizophora mucronata TaxID=61149 RepID=A0A2P2IQ11_RHIMU